MAAPLPARPFFFVRHTETEANDNGLICGGGWDPGLNAQGLTMARRLARRFAKNTFGIRVIYTSPLLRAIQTADVIHDVLHVRMSALSGLAERHLGQWEKKPLRDVKDFSPLAEGVAGGEAKAAFLDRVLAAMNRALEAGTPQPPLIVSHGYVGQLLLETLGLPEGEIEKGVLYRFEADDAGGWALDRP